MEQDQGGGNAETAVQRDDDAIPEYQEILNRVADSPRNYPVPRRVSRKHLEQAFLTSFELIGGVPRLALWADRNPDKFYALITKLFPQHVEGTLKADASLADILSQMKTERREPVTVDAEVVVVSETPANT